MTKTVTADQGLTFQALRHANRMRGGSIQKHAALQWEAAHWLQALVGEVGELANMLKKIDRGDTDPPTIGDLAEEIADIQTYLDLLADHIGVDLGEATIGKFNLVSKRWRSPITLEENGQVVLFADK